MLYYKLVKQMTVIRFAAAPDAAAMAELYRPYVLDTVYTFEYDPPDEAAFAGRLRRTRAEFPWLAAERDGRLLGYAYASRAFERTAYGWDADLSVYLGPDAQGRGLGRAFYTLLERMLAMQGYQVLYGVVTSGNEGSQRFHEALGYRLTAVLPDCGFKQGRWLSVCWYEKRLCPPVPPAGPPRPASEMDWTGLDLRGLDRFSIQLGVTA